VKQDRFCPSIFPNADNGSIAHYTAGKTPVKIVQTPAIFPPKGSYFSGSMWNFILIVFEPNQLNLGNVMLVVELMKMFNGEGIIL
jgi:hypothetical protein